jgi:hypothetical protein
MKIRSKLGALLGAGLLTFAIAGVASAATFDWTGNGFPSDTCTADGSPATMHWIWTGDSPTALTINGDVQTGSWVQSGNGSYSFDVTVDASNYPPLTASVTYTGNAGQLTLSHCDGTTATPTPEITGEGASDVVTQPPTDADLAANGTSGPGDGAWLLVVALGVLLASVVVLTPARAKSRR